MEKIELKDIKKYGRPPKSYPIWRRPLVKPSFYVSYYLVKVGLKNPTFLSFLMIIIGVTGGVLLFSNIYPIKIMGPVLILISYFIDLMDGKVARMLGKANKTGKFLDWNYHLPVTSLSLFGIGFSNYLDTDNMLYILLGFICSWTLILKTYTHSTFIHFLRDINQSKGIKIKDFEKETDVEYQRFLKKKYFKKSYDYFFRLFIDITDIWFLFLPIVILKLDKYLLMVLPLVYVPLLIISFYIKYKKLYEIEKM